MLAGDATTDAATKVVAMVATPRSIPPARRSMTRACHLAHPSATAVVTAASAIESGNRSVNPRSKTRGTANSISVSAAQ